MNRDLEIAFVQDAMLFQGGADKVVAAALDVFPQAHLYTLMYKPEPYKGTIFEEHPIHSSFLDRLPGAHRHHRLFLPLMPLALAQFDLRRFDIVIAFSYAVAHAVPTRPDQLHISYMHTPMRYAWQPHLVSQIFPGSSEIPFRLVGSLLSLFRLWDRAMTRRSDYFIANSNNTADLIWKAYHRQADVLYPPVETACFYPRQPRENYYIAVSRLIGHKRLDLVVRAFTLLGLPLLVVGEGPEEDHLRSLAGPNVEFLGWLSQDRLACYLGRAKAFVHASEEDFGIAIGEAQASGCPVVTFKRGASSEIVGDGITGLLFAEQNVECLVETVQRFEQEGVAAPPELIQSRTQRFNQDCFKQSFKAVVMNRWTEFEKKLSTVSCQPSAYPRRISSANLGNNSYGCSSVPGTLSRHQ
jgi:glycosyltransferase involved in cell wall biosynthesis